jgi:hypothetical protein
MSEKFNKFKQIYIEKYRRKEKKTQRKNRKTLTVSATSPGSFVF